MIWRGTLSWPVGGADPPIYAGGLQDGLGQHGVGVSNPNQVVNAEGSPHGASTEVFVLVLTQSRNGLKGQKHI